jgi:hypothetical protein
VWSLIKMVLIRIAAIRLVYRLFGGLLLVPLAFLLKFVGLPVLIVLSIIALPLMFALFAIGLPVFLVLLMGSALLWLLGFALSIGAVALKFAVLVVLPVWLIWKFVGAVRCRRRSGGSARAPAEPDLDAGAGAAATGDTIA